MHALLITFTSAAPLDRLAEPFTEYAHALRGVAGLVAKTWIFDGATVGGFYTFHTEQDIDAYLGGDLWATVADNAAFSAFRFQRFGIVDGLTALTSADALTASAA
ncbi:MAG: YdhR family protein [Ilumatobacteraceae bacterium]